MPATLAALESALATGTEAEWLAQLSDEKVREQVQRALQVDRKLWTQYPDSLGSCLLARTFGVKALASLHRAWAKELAARGRPWIRPLRPLPVEVLPLAELESAKGLSFDGLRVPRFVTDDELLLTPSQYGSGRKERVRWHWTEGRATVEPEPPGEAAARDPRFVSDGWGPTYLIRAEGAPPVALPCPEEGSAEARWSADGTRLIVYGTHDEYAGGFVYVVHPETLAIERALEVDSPVSSVADGGGRMVVSTSRSGMLGWVDGRKHVLPIFAYEFALSPSGKHVAAFDGSLKIWSLAELVRAEAQPPEPGFPPCFDPDGERLLCDRELLDGRTGKRVARLNPALGPYLEGGPPQPSLHLGTRVLVCTHGGLQLWDARTGKPLESTKLPGFSRCYTLAYDREGSRLAAMEQGKKTVVLHELPHGRRVGAVRFELAGEALGMAGDGSMLAVQKGGEVEVRAVDGALVRRCGVAVEASRERRSYDPPPRFSRDGRRIAARVGDGWQIWTLASGEEERVADDLADVADFAAPRPPGWKLERGKLSVFTHEASGARIALPVSGGWQFNPADPRIGICNDLLVVLEG